MLQPYVIESKEENGILSLKIDPNVACDSDRIVPMLQQLISLKQTLGLEPYIKQQIICSKEDAGKPFVHIESMVYHIKKREMFEISLKGYFLKDLTKEDVAEGLNFLMADGMSTQDLEHELGLSQASLYRLRNSQSDKQPSAPCSSGQPVSSAMPLH
jgi:hypothetical protein